MQAARGSRSAAAAVAALAGLLTVSATAAQAPAAHHVQTDNSMTYNAALSQDPAGPVLTTIVVSSNATTITFQVNTPNRPSFTGDMSYDIFVDSDNTPSTGSDKEVGADVALEVSGFTGEAALHSFFSTGGDSWISLPTGSDETWTYASGLTATVPRSVVEAEGPRGPSPTIRFRVFVSSGIVYDATTQTFDYSSAHTNSAPQGDSSAFFSYDFERGVSEPPRPPESILASKLTISKARAGKAFTVSMVVTDSESGLPAKNADVTCRARIGGKALAVRRSSVSSAGRMTCVWQLPKSSRGKQISGSIAASYPRVIGASRSFVVRIA